MTNLTHAHHQNKNDVPIRRHAKVVANAILMVTTRCDINNQPKRLFPNINQPNYRFIKMLGIRFLLVVIPYVAGSDAWCFLSFDI
jgi:hypothetical protein